jgi:hypothetical protein
MQVSNIKKQDKNRKTTAAGQEENIIKRISKNQ